MRNIILVFKYSILRNRLMLILAAAAVLLMINILNSMSKAGSLVSVEKINVGLIDYDGSLFSDDLKKYLQDTLDMNVIEENDYDLLADLLIDTEISTIIEIPRGMYDGVLSGNFKDLIVTTLDDYANAAFIEAYLESYMQSMTLLSRAADGSEEKLSEMFLSDFDFGSIKETKKDNRAQEEKRMQDAYVFAVGFMLMIISGITLFISNTILADKQLGTYNRMQCSAIKPFEYIIGVGMFGILCCSVMKMVFTLYVFSQNVDIGISFGLAVLIDELFILFSVGLAIVFALCVQVQTTLFTIICGYTTIGCILGGAWFPIGDDLGFVSNVAKIFPQYWFMDILRNLPQDISAAAPNICILALWTLLVYLVSAVIFTKRSS